MRADEILARFDHFIAQHGADAFHLITEFLHHEQERFYRECKYDDPVRCRQGWVSTVGKVLEGIILKLLAPFCEEHGLAMTRDSALKNPKTAILRAVRQQLEIPFGEHTLLPDGDIVIFCPASGDVLAVISVKNSFRERYTETPYWKLKLKEQATARPIRVFMVTPDHNDEVSSIFGQRGPKKARLVMASELDGLYLAKETFEPGDKVKSIAELIPDLERLLEENPCS